MVSQHSKIKEHLHFMQNLEYAINLAAGTKKKLHFANKCKKLDKCKHEF